MVDIKTIRELAKLMVANDLTELDLHGENERVTLKRGRSEMQPVMVPPALPPHAQAVAPLMATTPPGTSPSASGEDGLTPLTSPMVGTFYLASGPDSKPFVEVGSHVTADAVVCVIEAMKVFNEIKAEMSGRVEKILVRNGQTVEFGQPLFMVGPE